MGVVKPFLISFDRGIFFFFQHLQRPWLDPVLAWPTYLGDTALACVWMCTFLLIYDHRPKGFLKIPFVLLALLGTDGAGSWMKAFFARPRPFVYWEHVNVLFHKPTNGAFPSGHTAIIFAAAVLLNLFYPKKMKWAYGVAVWVSLTRLYVGVHYPTDLVGGALVGTACAALSYFLFKGFFDRGRIPA